MYRLEHQGLINLLEVKRAMKKTLGNEDSGAVPFRALRAVIQDQKATFAKISGVMCPENPLIAIIMPGKPFLLFVCAGVSPDRVLLDIQVKTLLYSRLKEEVLISSTSRLLRLISSSTIQTVAFTAGGTFLGIPFVFLVYLWPTPIPALLFLLIPIIFGHMYLGPLMAILLGIGGAERRALASATCNLVINLVAMGVGPLLVGISSDHLLPPYCDESLRSSILTVVVVATSWTAIHFLLANKTLREDLAAADEG